MQTVERETLLQELQSVQPGLSPREIIEQSGCFIFRDGNVETYNGEIACLRVCSVKLEGAVKAAPLLALLEKIPDETITVTQSEKGIKVAGKGRAASFNAEVKITLPVDGIEPPDKWTKLVDGFAEAVKVVQYCAASDQTHFEQTCIHITPDFLEACDNSQMARYALKTGFKQRILVRRDSLKHIIGLAMTHFSETGTWIHFRSKDGLVLSCQRSLEKYPDLDQFYATKGHKLALPAGLPAAAERAEVFSAASVDGNLVTIDLLPDKLRITGQSDAVGWYRETKETKYAGPPASFLIAPALLKYIVEHVGTTSTVTEGALRIAGDAWIYVSALGKPEAE